MFVSRSWTLMGVLEDRRGAKTYGKGSQRIWSTQENEALLECLRDIVRSGWKCDNGFQTCYLETYACITDMLARSGFGWNETTQMIVVSNEVLDSYTKIDPFAKTLRFKSFPYYPTWSEIFRKDRATREHAEDIYNASNNEFMNSFTQSTAHLDAAPSDTERVSSKKRKKFISTVDEKFDAKFDTFVNVTDNRLGDLAKRFGIEQDESHARRQAWSAVESISDFTIEKKCIASKKLVNNKNDLDLFLTISTAAQEAFVKLIVDGKV
ncbi:UNVERIFIED_CONTAM: hypothetical protein Slati_4497300 [Sesamum latifolium]|uniref:Myb/SANT-like domain-containing protein n=1 Tax=Sesamum latifolium TaxID=2727402 RepID=A0AAW2SUT6_9LAMI